MKKINVFFAVAAIMMCTFSTNTLASVKIKPKKMTTQEIDSLYNKSPYIVNSLEKEKQTITYCGDGRMHLFIGTAGDNTVNMCKIEMPSIMESQTTSLQLVVNGSQQFTVPLKLSYQVYDDPKYIDGKIVVRAYIGMYNPEKTHFYLVVNPDGSGYDTE